MKLSAVIANVFVIGVLGTTLTSRQLGKEVLAAFHLTLAQIAKAEKIEIDFAGVTTLSPSWGDEFIGALHRQYGRRLVLKRSDNLSVIVTLRLLEQVYGYKFTVVP